MNTRIKMMPERNLSGPGGSSLKPRRLVALKASGKLAKKGGSIGHNPLAYMWGIKQTQAVTSFQKQRTRTRCCLLLFPLVLLQRARHIKLYSHTLSQRATLAGPGERIHTAGSLKNKNKNKCLLNSHPAPVQTCVRPADSQPHPVWFKPAAETSEPRCLRTHSLQPWRENIPAKNTERQKIARGHSPRCVRHRKTTSGFV